MVTDNDTNIAVYNLITPGKSDHKGLNIITVDALTADDACGRFNSSGIDNLTGCIYSITRVLFDNVTAKVHFINTYVLLYGDTQTFYVVVDNNIETSLLTMVDNTTQQQLVTLMLLAKPQIL